MIPCPMTKPNCQYLCIGEDNLARHLSWDHRTSDVAYLVVELLRVNKKAQEEFENLTKPKEENDKELAK